MSDLGKKFKAQTHIGRVSRSIGDDYITIEIKDKVNFNILVELEVPLATFSEIVTGLSCEVDGVAFQHGFENLGKKREYLSLQIDYSHIKGYGEDAKAEAREYAKSLAGNGWTLVDPGFGNMHRACYGEGKSVFTAKYCKYEDQMNAD